MSETSEPTGPDFDAALARVEALKAALEETYVSARRLLERADKAGVLHRLETELLGHIAALEKAQAAADGLVKFHTTGE